MGVQGLTDKLSDVQIGTDNKSIDLNAPWTSDKILEVRRGSMQPLPGLKVFSGIDKSTCDEPVYVGPGGIVDDEHDYTFHGGPDKAVHACKHPQFTIKPKQPPSLTPLLPRLRLPLFLLADRIP